MKRLKKNAGRTGIATLMDQINTMTQSLTQIQNTKSDICNSLDEEGCAELESTLNELSLILSTLTDITNTADQNESEKEMEQSN
jgi:hypothetical protein